MSTINQEDMEVDEELSRPIGVVQLRSEFIDQDQIGNATAHLAKNGDDETIANSAHAGNFDKIDVDDIDEMAGSSGYSGSSGLHGAPPDRRDQEQEDSNWEISDSEEEDYLAKAMDSINVKNDMKLPPAKTRERINTWEKLGEKMARHQARRLAREEQRKSSKSNFYRSESLKTVTKPKDAVKKVKKNQRYQYTNGTNCQN